ncbi:LytR/AlgR family response regulator transcription factor [Aureispira anguillae]|uniref:LytTR family DNA-binding domain-containing protein n=1 Tax=Aureispira anguillae TaxID=2864201 RepID=A0A915YDR6_9BACT|nr:LytTR family DNA-binding domain-containing protein [Aureispira anguillae]BDS11240.1 LytTR family DNA-binding domain-containing protein [Aureispira anguillae]
MGNKQKITCIAVDDEPFALALIEDFCAKIPQLELIDLFDNPFEALDYLRHHKPDAVFMDIKMPEISGIQLIQQIPEFPALIFTTAHSKYAVESYNLNALDYLLKPFDFERFYKAVQKVEKHLARSTFMEQEEEKRASIVVKVEYKNVQILLADILYVEAMDNYVKIHTAEKYYLTQQSMKFTLQSLPEDNFCRVHKSYIVALSKVDHFSYKSIAIQGQNIPIGRTFLQKFRKKIAKL